MPLLAYSKKADKYARYRWNYAQEAVETIFCVTGLCPRCAVADIGSGTGILTKHLADRVEHVYAVEPDPAMQAIAERDLSPKSSFRPVNACAEGTTLPDHSVDLITVAQALHWFAPEQTRQEFRRILKPGSWLAILSNCGTNPDLEEASAELYTAANGWNTDLDQGRAPQPPLSYYYGHNCYLERSYPFSLETDWETFRGSLLSDSRAPDEDHPLYPNLEACQLRIFDRFATSGRITLDGCTKLVLGRIG